MEDKRLAVNPSGLCMCGCGRKTKIVTKHDRRHGHIVIQLKEARAEWRRRHGKYVCVGPTQYRDGSRAPELPI
jgi:hypothetical protein